MSFNEEELQKHIPYYLTAEDRATLVKELTAISQGGAARYFLDPYCNEFKDDMLQGDGWRGFTYYHHAEESLFKLRALILSNSCDIDPANPRELPTRVVFAPLVKLSAFQSLLEESDLSSESVAAKIASIKAQKTTNIFYLPAGGSLDEDHLVRLDEIQSIPKSSLKDNSIEKIFTLSNTGFYMLIFKISLHFCRLQEKINRPPEAVA